MDYINSKVELYDRNNKLIEATLALFKGVPKLPNSLRTPTKLHNEINVNHGFYITEEAHKNCPQIADSTNLELIEKLYGYDLIELNRGFYKSFGTVKNASVEKLLADQILHYFTTYGLEAMGLGNPNLVYIPNDFLNLPKDATPIKITVIKFISKDEIKQRTLQMIKSGMALSDKTLEYMVTIIQEMKMKSAIIIEEVPNKELRIKLCDLLGKMPLDPVEFLRYMVYKKLNNGYSMQLNPLLLIKSPETISAIKINDKKVEENFKEYINYNDGLKRLATIFHRYKPLWLAFKKESHEMATIINRMRKLANTYHKPLKPKILDIITSSREIDMNKLRSELDKVTIFKKISLINSILFRRANPESIAFFIRNGKAFATEYDNNFTDKPEVFDLLMNSIIESIRPQVEGKTVYIPENFNYAMPTSEKLFWGAIPYNSSYTLSDKNIVIAVHWENVKNAYGDENRVDLDLHLQSAKYDVGWNTHLINDNVINTKESKIIFSGDMTDAPIDKGGATEAFFIGQNLIDDIAMVNLNDYTNSGIPIPFKFVIDEVKQDRINLHYLINSHTMSFCISNEMVGTERFLGFLNSDEVGNKKFYFTSASLGNRIVSKHNENSENMIKAMMCSFESCLKLRDVLGRAGAVFEKSDDADWDINLDPQLVSKDTIMSLLIN